MSRPNACTDRTIDDMDRCGDTQEQLHMQQDMQKYKKNSKKGLTL